MVSGDGIGVFTPGESIGVDAAMRRLISLFKEKKLETPALDARILTLAAASVSLEEMICTPNRILSKDQMDKLNAFAVRRFRHEPVSRILGRREFMGREYVITPDVLDPRPDSEILVETALTCTLPASLGRILDLGTGSGCLLISLLAEMPDARGIGVDASVKALACARRNAMTHKVYSRSEFICGDWYASIRGEFDLVITNPPYITREDVSVLAPDVREYDPLMALEGGEDGLMAYRAILGNIRQVIKPGGWLVMEFGAGQAEALALMMKTAGFPEASLVRDLSGQFRVLKGKFVKN